MKLWYTTFSIISVLYKFFRNFPWLYPVVVMFEFPFVFFLLLLFLCSLFLWDSAVSFPKVSLWIERKANENCWPQYDAVTVICTNVGLYGISAELLRRYNMRKREDILKKQNQNQKRWPPAYCWYVVTAVW